MRTRVKICGLTRLEDIRAAVDAGVDALGLVFYPKSPRHLELARAVELAAAIPAFVTTVALFKDAPAAQVEQVLHRLPVDLLQFHGGEPAAFCEQFDRPYIKALGMKPAAGGASDAEGRLEDLRMRCAAYTSARGILLDAHAPGEAGGTGEVFDWNGLCEARASIPQALVLAGGLHADNVAGAIRLARPFAVDVSSGVETAPGIKSAEKIRRFMQQVAAADSASK